MENKVPFAATPSVEGKLLSVNKGADVTENTPNSTEQEGDVQADATAGNANINETPENDMVKTILAVGAEKIHPRYKAQFLLSELLGAGYKLAFDSQNREIVESHVKALYDDVKGSKSKCFSEAGKTTLARKLLEENKKLYDETGNEITLATSDVDMYLVVLDAQHRTMVCMLHPEIDLWLEIADFECDSSEFYVKFNNLRRNHSGSDQKHMIQQMYDEDKVTLITKMDEVKKTYKVTDKFAEALLTGKVDTFKKKILADIQLGKMGIENKFYLDQEKAKIGMAVMDIVNATYASNADLLKKFKKYQFPMALWNIYDGKDSEEKKSFMYDFCGFLKYSDVTTVTAIMEKVDDKNFANAIRPKLSKYVKSLSDEDKVKRDAEITCLIETSKSARNANPAVNPNGKVKAICSGTFSEVLANMKALAKQKDEIAKQKAQKTASKETPTPAYMPA